MWDNLPTEITTLILLKLPVKTLIVCTCLSKSFFSLITSHEFIKTHVAHNPTTHFFLRYYTHAKKEEYYHFEPDNDNFTGFQNEGLSMPFEANFLFNVAGCVNGVLCLVNDCFCEGTLIILWNLSIRKYVRVPEPHYVIESYGGYESACGFGFDPVTNDYKVVRVVNLVDQEPYSEESEIEIYSLRSGCWRNAGIGPKYNIKRSNHVYIPCFFNGSVHWVGSTECENVILKFDMSKESCEIMEVPSMLKENSSSYALVTPVTDFYVLESKGMLTLIRWNYAENVKTYCVWVMKEYGVANSWTKMIEFEYGYEISARIPMAIGFRTNGEAIIVKGKIIPFSFYEKDKNLIVSFNPAAHGETILGELSVDDTEPISFYLSTYVESMVLFREGKGIDDRTKQTVLEKKKVMVNDGDLGSNSSKLELA